VSLFIHFAYFELRLVHHAALVLVIFCANLLKIISRSSRRPRRRYQRSTELLIRKLPFARLVKEIQVQFTNKVRPLIKQCKAIYPHAHSLAADRKAFYLPDYELSLTR
jgi:hypothetical protein